MGESMDRRAAQAVARMAVGLGMRVREERVRRRLTLAQVGAQAGLSTSAVHRVETGRPAALGSYARIAAYAGPEAGLRSRRRPTARTSTRRRSCPFLDGRGRSGASAGGRSPGCVGRAVSALPVRRPRRSRGVVAGTALASAYRKSNAVPEPAGRAWQLQREAGIPCSCARGATQSARRVLIGDARACRAVVGRGAARRQAEDRDVPSDLPG